MEIINKIFIMVLILLPAAAEACPSCAASNNGRFFLQSLIAVAVMWFLPVVIALLIGIKVYKMCCLERTKLPESRV